MVEIPQKRQVQMLQLAYSSAKKEETRVGSNSGIILT